MNKILQTLREGMTQKLIVGTSTTGAINGGQTLAVDVPIEYSKILIKSIQVKCSKNIRFTVSFVEDRNDIEAQYHSGTAQHRLLDVLDYAYIDKRGQNLLYLNISNLEDAGVNATFSVEIRGLQLK